MSGLSDAIDFLKAFHPAGRWVITAINPAAGLDRTRTQTFGSSTGAEAERFLAEWNGKWNLYFTVNRVGQAMGNKPERTDFCALDYLHVDIDPRVGEDLEAEGARILALLTTKLPTGVPKPTAIVFSGGGYQAFWKLAEPLPLDGTLERAEEAKLWNLALERKFGADSCHNIDRIMRLPGTVNMPNAKKLKKGRVPTMAHVVEADWSRVYALDSFTPAPATPVANNNNVRKGVTVNVGGERAVLADVHDLDQHTADGKPLEDRVKRIIQEGYDPLDDKPDAKPRDDRSVWVFDATCALVRRGVPDNVIVSVLLDRGFKISDHIYDQKGGAEKYAIRQIKQAKEKVDLSAADTRIDKAGQGRTPVLLKSDPMHSAREFRSSERPHLLNYNSDWLTYEAGAYNEMETATVRAEAYAFLEGALSPTGNDGEEEAKFEPFRPTKHKVNDVIDALAALVHRPRDQFEPPAWLDGDGPRPSEVIACRNGLLHVPSGELLKSTPRFFTRNALAFDHQPEAPVPRQWLEFLTQVWPGGEEVDTLQEIFGYLLVPDTSQQKIFLLVGPKRSGKGTIARVLTRLIGDRNICSPSLNKLSETFGLEPLIGKQLAIVSDMRVGFKTDVAAVAEDLLRISGEDAVTVNRKYKGAWTGRLGVRFLIMSNETPRLPDASGALASRFIPLIMENSFIGREDTELTSRLLTELPGILNWAIEGWQRLQSRGRFQLPASSLQAVDDLEDMASPVRAFMREMCELETDAVTSKDALFAAFRHWCEDNKEQAGNKRVFAKNLIAASGRRVKTTKPRDGNERRQCYRGIRLIGNTGALVHLKFGGS